MITVCLLPKQRRIAQLVSDLCRIMERSQKDVNSARRALFPRDASEASNLILAAELQAENDTTSVKFTKVHFKVLFREFREITI